MRPFRIPLHDFPDLVLHADELAVKRHAQYSAAKAGDADAAKILVESFANRGRVSELASLLEGRDIRLLPVHALESEGVNEIPAAPWPSWCRGGWACRLASPWCNRIRWVTLGKRVPAARKSGSIYRRGRAWPAIPSCRRFCRAGRHAGEPNRVYRTRRGPSNCGHGLDRKTVLRQAGSR
jgi:hypothetical protein